MKRCILLIEHDETAIDLMREAVTRLRLPDKIQIARTGQMAIDYISGVAPYGDRGQYPLPTVILLNLDLPLKDGFEVLDWIRSERRFRSIPVIALSALLHSDAVEKAYLMGANSCINKPATLPDLMRLVLFLEGWWLQCNVAPTPGRLADPLDPSRESPVAGAIPDAITLEAAVVRCQSKLTDFRHSG